MKEIELYEPMCIWLRQYLKDKYKKAKSIIVEDTHSITLETALRKHNLSHSSATGIDIEIDVLGIVLSSDGKFKLFFVEAKVNKLTLRDLGQLWSYCKLINPEEAYLLSPAGLGTLDTVLRDYKREDMIQFGDGKSLKLMKIAKWNLDKNSPDFLNMIGK